MRKALFKKQMMEVFSWVFWSKKTGRRRSAKGLAGYVLLYLLIFGFLGVIFYLVADLLCGPLVAAGMGWLYFALMGMLALFLGVFGSVFNTYASLYQAKDNDLLLAMPVPPGAILLVRLAGVYAMGLMYELIVMIPAMVCWFLNAPVGAAGVIFTLLIPLVLSVLVLVLSAVLGWLVALISGRLKRKNGVVVILSLVFITAYYYFYARAYSILQGILADPQEAGARVRGILYPLYHMGLAAEGSAFSMAVFTAIAGVLFGAVYLALSRSFVKITTMSRGVARTEYKEGKMTARSVSHALFRKEMGRFLGSSNYMLNCGLGVVIMVVSAGALLWKQEVVRETMFGAFSWKEGLPFLMASGVICLLSVMNDIAAPSVSLEGKNLWILQVFPVSGWQALMAKLKLHLVLTLVPAAVLVGAAEWVLRPDLGFAILIPLVTALFILMMAAFGLFVNLQAPNLNWTSEIVPIKQGLSVTLSLLGGWALIAVLALLYYALQNVLSPLVFLICMGVLLLALSASLLRWLKTRGAEIFERL